MELLKQILFQGWEPLLRTAIGTTVTYVALVILLRFAGQRTLAKWYAFDLIVTVALGLTFANTVLANRVTVAQSLVGFTILIGPQFCIAFAVVRWIFAGHYQSAADILLHCGRSSTMRCAGSASLRPTCAPRF
jgi:hypothetical protein